MRDNVARAATFLTGLFYTVTSITMLAAPEWFFASVGHWPPFNRHYIGDTGAFLLIPGIGLLVAARAPHRHLVLIGATLLASVVHTVNHVADLVGIHAHLTHWLMDLGPLLLLLLIMVLALTAARTAEME